LYITVIKQCHEAHYRQHYKAQHLIDTYLVTIICQASTNLVDRIKIGNDV